MAISIQLLFLFITRSSFLSLNCFLNFNTTLVFIYRTLKDVNAALDEYFNTTLVFIYHDDGNKSTSWGSNFNTTLVFIYHLKQPNTKGDRNNFNTTLVFINLIRTAFKPEEFSFQYNSCFY